jgi:hypothetical protein
MTDHTALDQMRASFEASLPQRVERASRLKIHPFIPSHWFAAAASECQRMFVAGYFYGAISAAQASVEALSLFLRDLYQMRGAPNDPDVRWENLHRNGLVSKEVLDAAKSIFSDRNDYHHLNRSVEQGFQNLETRAEVCVNHLHTIESEVFAFSIQVPGKITPKHPERWIDAGNGLTAVHLRQRW